MASWTVKQLTAKLILSACSLLALTACASAPVQEMSDARQAIYSAEASGAVQRSPATLLTAQRLLQEAQERLEAGAYGEARRYALDARDAAIQAREQAARNAALRPAP
jgi:prophage DNA circulation protein